MVMHADVSPPFNPIAGAAKPRRKFVSLGRILRGGGLKDGSRIPRYVWIFALGTAAIWAPITGYLKTAPLSYTSHMSLILPGSGASSSVNLADIGQASSFANSAFSSGSVSPTETYKRLLSADRVLRDAASRAGVTFREFGKPQVQLVDQTAFIHIKMTGPSPADVQARNGFLLDAFLEEIDRLRNDERDSRHTSSLTAIREYQQTVGATREKIEELQRKTGLHSVEQFQRQIQEADALQLKIEALSAARERGSATVKGLESKLNLDAETAALTLRLNNDETYVALLQVMAQASGDLATAQARYGAKHPDVVKASRAMQAARSKAQTRAIAVTGQPLTLEGAIDGGRGALLTELVRQETARSGLDAELKDLRALLQQHTARLDELAPYAARLEDKQRDFNVAEAVFASAIARSQSSRTDVYASYPLVQTLEDPTLPEDPSSPRRMLAVAAGGAATFLLIFALFLGWVRRGLIDKILVTK